MTETKRLVSDRELVRALGPVGDAFFGSFRTLRDVQRAAIPRILEGRDVLLASATASGKTEAVLAPLVARTWDRVSTHGSGIRMLLVAPTRALVNDLAARLDGPLGRLGLTCGRQTSDHRDKHRRPFVLITTPESFDSMLVRDGRVEGGRITDHLLATVSVVFVDEAHLFDSTARGDQLSWLMGRLRRVRRLTDESGTDDRAGLQVCAGSATISDPQGLARRLLGPSAVAVEVPGTRELEVFGPSGAAAWFPVEPSLDAVGLRDRLELAPAEKFAEAAERRIWQALSGAGDTRLRKALVFAPTRRLVDTLSTELAAMLPRRRAIRVLAHHGSLERAVRERAEGEFAAAGDAVLVATTTLEVGVDIGDVDFVALVGAPPGTRSLLQRIGRAGRRIGCTRVLALPRTAVEQAALASMLIAARDGRLEPEGYARRWSVFVQQAASFVAQGRPRGRKRSHVVELAQDVWPDDEPASVDAIVEHLLDEDRLIEDRGRLWLGEPWADLFDAGGRGMHANFGSPGAGVPAVDASTGEVIAYVAGPPSERKGLALGGQSWDMETVSGEILLRPRGARSAREGFRYVARRAPVRREYAVHVRRGLGMEEEDAPLVDLSSGLTWFHFGGAEYEIALCELVQGLRPIGALAGLAVRVDSGGALSSTRLDVSESRLRQVVDDRFADLERVLAVGPYQHALPEARRRSVVAALMDVPVFRRWLQCRRVWRMTSDDSRCEHVRAI